MKKDGFTLIELLVVVAISVVMIVTGFSYFGTYRSEQDLKLTANEIVAAVKNTQQLSRSQQGGSRWGIRFSNATSSQSYSVFSGMSYATGTVANFYSIRRPGICFIDPSASTTKEVVFQPISAYVSNYFSVTLGLCNDASRQKVIEITTLGMVSALDGEGFAVQSISPSSGANNGSVSISTVLGANFKSGATVKLSKAGQSDINGTGFTVANYSTINGGSFNIVDAATGPWDVVVTNPDSSSSTLPGGFTVVLPAPVVTTANPSSGARNTTVSGISIGGAYFQNGGSVKLKRGGYSDVNGTGFTFSSPTSFINGSFNLNGVAAGLWDVAVTNPDAQIGMLVNGFQVTVATGTIDGTYRYAWNDNYGWWDFATSTSNVSVTDTELTGYAWNASAGLLSLNCSNTATCGTVNYKVANNGSGTLSGYAWNDTIGWVSFSCADAGTCGVVNYGVTIDSSGDFHGWAWSDNIGWVSFNCLNTATCGAVNYKVNTTWRP
ncbi:MAG: type II secretion system protein [Minisyncoccia bacterium]